MAKAAQFDESFVGEKPSNTPSMAHLAATEELRVSSVALSKRSMVLDEERFEEQFLRCNICKDRFHNESLPRMLPCHHSFCQRCIDHLYRIATEQRLSYSSSMRPLASNAVSISCPTCRSNFVATEDLIRRLPTDHRVVQLMDFVHHTERYTVTFCSKHPLQPLNFFCEPCVKPVCRDCTVLDHKESDGHLVMDLDEALAKYTPVLDNAMTEMDTERVCLEDKGIALESVTKALDKIQEDLLTQVKSCMDRMKELVEERSIALQSKVRHEVEVERRKLQEKSEMLESRCKVLSDQTIKLKTAKEEVNVEDMFRIHQEVKEYRSGPALRIREVDDGLVTSFVLNSRDEAVLASRISNFGDINSKVETLASRNKSATTAYVYRSSSFR